MTDRVEFTVRWILTEEERKTLAQMAECHDKYPDAFVRALVLNRIWQQMADDERDAEEERANPIPF